MTNMTIIIKANNPVYPLI